MFYVIFQLLVIFFSLGVIDVALYAEVSVGDAVAVTFVFPAVAFAVVISRQSFGVHPDFGSQPEAMMPIAFGRCTPHPRLGEVGHDGPSPTTF